MKKIKMAVVMVMMVGALTACGSKKAAGTTEAVTTEAVTTEAVTTEAATTEAVTTEAVTTEAATTDAATADATVSQTITGEILDAAMSTIIIKAEDGRELIFLKEDAETDLKDGLLIGNSVTIEYTGEINDLDTTETTVLKISDAK